MNDNVLTSYSFLAALSENETGEWDPASPGYSPRALDRKRIPAVP